jgi:uncharacterized membrane protein
MKKLFRNKQAEGYLSAMILVIAVLMATIIGAMIFFAFSNSGSNASYISETYTGTGASGVFYWPLKAAPGTSPTWNITISGGAVTTKYAGASNYTYVSANNTIKTNANFFKTGYNTVVIKFYTQAKDTISSVALIAVTAFALLAIVPLIMVGGLMLRSLGYMGGGKEV